LAHHQIDKTRPYGRGQYSLLHYTCAAGDIGIFDRIFASCKDLRRVLFDCD
jgi:hypothetical protein